MNGSGMPVIGMMPIVIPTFSKIWNTNIARTPTQTSVPKSSRAGCAVLQTRHTMIASRPSRVAPPSEAELLPDRSEDEVGVLLGHVAEAGLVATEETLAGEPARADGDLGLVEVVGLLAGWTPPSGFLLDERRSRSFWYCARTPD